MEANISNSRAIGEDAGALAGLIVLGLAVITVTINRAAGEPVPDQEMTALVIAGVLAGLVVCSWIAHAATETLKERAVAQTGNDQ